MRAYRALLHLYPSSFRREYGTDLAADFARRWRDRSGVGVIALWVAAIADVVANAGRLHLELLRQDLKYAARTFARTPGFVVTAILVTALGIGATTAAFSVTNYVFLRPLPYADPDRLVTVWHRTPDYRLELSPPNFRDLKAQTTSFEALGAYHGFDANIVAGAEPERLTGAAVTSEVLPLLGVRPVIGRLFTAEEERQATGSFAVLSYGFWQRAFGGDAGVLGRTIRIDGTPHVVVGVMPAAFAFPRRQVELWTLMPAVERLNEERDNYWFNGIGRLKPGVTATGAEADLRVIAARLERQYPDVNTKISAGVFQLREEYSDRARAMLYALCGASLSVLLIACANLANLLLARSYARRRELELRAALGAGRERLVRQLVTESLLVALLGGALGVLVAVASVPLLARLIPMSMPLTDTPSVDLPALVVAACLTLVTGIAFGVLPALRSSSTSSFDALREGVRGGGLRGVRTRSALVVIEVAACVVLLVWAGLLMRALHRLDSLDPGFQSEQVLTVQTALPRPKYNSAALRQHYFDSVLAQVRALPGVKSAAFISFLPMTMGGGIFPVGLPGQPAMMTNGRIASMRFATPGYFATLGIPLRRGRDLQQADTLSQPLVAVVSESFARRYFPDQDVVGKQFEFAYATRTIVGVVGDVRVRGPEQGSEPQVYLPSTQLEDESFPFFTPKDLAIRSDAPTEALLPMVRSIVRSADPEQPVSNIRTMSQIVERQTESRIVQVRVLAAFAVIALVLAAVGIHGLLAFTVVQRRHEIGVRMALGAEPERIVSGILKQSAVLALCGIVPGVAIGYAGGRAMESLLVGVTPGDGVTLAAAAALCAAVTLAGSWAPAVRAVRVSPASVFRGD
jgi:putative ABC transport system permease protein